MDEGAIDGADAESPAIAPRPARVQSIDATRGFVMWLIASGGFGLRALPEEGRWSRVGSWFHHVPWDGIVAWDVIQPTFTFVAGASLALAVSRRRASGASPGAVWRWLLGRAARLVIASQVIIALARGEVLFQLIDSLSQIAISMIIVYAIVQMRVRWQVVAGVALLVVHTAAHWLWAPAEGGAWAAYDTAGVRLDRFVFGWPYYDGAYSTFNVVSGSVLTLVGWWTGLLLAGRPTRSQATKRLLGGALVAWFAALVVSPLAPPIKALGTPTFVLLALGWVLTIAWIAYLMCDTRESRFVGRFLMVIGQSAILVYFLDNTARWWFESAVTVFSSALEDLGAFGPWPVVVQFEVGIVMWLMCWWLHRRNVTVTL